MGDYDYDMLPYDDPRRSYRTLLHLIDRCIQKQREQKMLKQTQVGLQQMIQGKDPLSALAAKVKGTKAATPAPKKPTKPPKHEEAAPVPPQSKAKAHAKAKAGKDKGKGKGRDRSESVDAKAKMKHIRCRFFFSESGECRNGDKCPYSHSKKTPERGRGTSPNPRREPSRSPSAGQGEKVCFQYKNNGVCHRANCPYKHADPATPAEGKPKAKAKAEAKSKAEAKPKQGNAKAVPAAPAIRLCRAWNPLAPAVQKRNNIYDTMTMKSRSVHPWTATLIQIVPPMTNRLRGLRPPKRRQGGLLPPSPKKRKRCCLPTTFDSSQRSHDGPTGSSR